MAVEKGKDHEHRHEPDRIDGGRIRELIELHASRPVGPFWQQAREERVEHEFERIDVEQHQEEQDGVEDNGVGVLHPEATEERVVLGPDPDQYRETAREGREAHHELHQLVVVARHLEGDHQERQRKGEDRIAERLQPRHFVPAPPKRIDHVPLNIARGSPSESRIPSPLSCVPLSSSG
jgi:hypothetical protein